MLYINHTCYFIPSFYPIPDAIAASKEKSALSKRSAEEGG